MGHARRGPTNRAGTPWPQYDHNNDDAHFAPNHAMRSIIQVQKMEAQDVMKARATNGRQATAVNETKIEVPIELVEAAMPGRGIEPLRPLRGSGF